MSGRVITLCRFSVAVGWIVCASIAILFTGCSSPQGLTKLDTLLIYEFEPLEAGLSSDEIEASVLRRLDSSGSLGLQVNCIEPTKLEIVVPGNSYGAVAQCKALMRSTGELQMHMVAQRSTDSDLVEPARALSDDENLVIVDGKTVASWVPLAADSNGLPLADDNRPFAPRYKFAGVSMTANVVRLVDDVHHVLLIHSQSDIDNRHFASISKSVDVNGQPAINFSMTAAGAARIKRLTSANLDKQMAIIFDGELITAPVIRSAIGGEGMITGNFTQREIDFMHQALQATEMPIKILGEPDSKAIESPE